MVLEQMKLKLTAVFELAPEGGFTCHFEELPEVFSEGATLDEANVNLMDAHVMDYRRDEARKTAAAWRVADGASTGRLLKRLDPECHLCTSPCELLERKDHRRPLNDSIWRPARNRRMHHN